MKNFKTFGVIGLLAFSFIFMSFSKKAEDLYGASYTVNHVSAENESPDQAQVLRATLRLTVRATRSAIAYTREVARVQLPGIREVTRQASTWTIYAIGTVEQHKENYLKNIAEYKKQKVRSLG